MTVGLAFQYFKSQAVHIAVVEVGLGGRLDSTNVINPVVAAITNIGWDHMQLLGDSLEAIAMEKAGIIKTGIPVVVGEERPELIQLFQQIAQGTHSIPRQRRGFTAYGSQGKLSNKKSTIGPSVSEPIDRTRIRYSRPSHIARLDARFGNHWFNGALAAATNFPIGSL